MSEQENFTPEEKHALKEYLGVGAVLPEEKHNVHSFLHKVATSEDTTKTGNLSSEEVGFPSTNLRATKEIELMAREIMGNTFFADYFQKEAEILTSTSLSKDAKLLNLAVMQKRVIEDATKPERKPNAGWFGRRKDVNQQGQEGQ